MKRISTVLCLVMAMSTVLFARTDQVVLEVKYDVRQRFYVEDIDLMPDQMTLLIGENMSLFKSATAELLARQRDSIAQAAVTQLGLPMSGMMMGGGVQMMGADGYQVLKNMPAPGRLTLLDGVGGKPYRVEESMPEPDWELVEGDSVVAEYACQKAVAQWRGRTWTVWYALDLPYSDGPWKLCGLPGLILSAHDATGEFMFDCISIKKGDSRPIDIEGKSEKCTLRQLQDMKTREAKDPVGFVFESLGLGGMLGGGSVQVITMGGDDGRPAEVPSRTPVFIEQPD